jgi:hypothetical protein
MKTEEIVFVQFGNFELPLPLAAAEDCHHQGACDGEVEYWQSRVNRPDSLTPEVLASELKGYGAWDADELADDAANWRRILWLAAGQYQEEKLMIAKGEL